MHDHTTHNFATSILLDENEHTWSTPLRTYKTPTAPKFPPDEDIELWLKHNAPVSFPQLADIRYALYHHCTRNEFLVAHVSEETFSLTGRHSTLDIVSGNARKYLLWRLRQLGRKKSWINALPKTKNPRY
jgi:hypothetical protein